MTTIEIVNMGDGQVIKLPEGFRFDAESVSIRQEGESVIIEPVKPQTWPKDFFEAIKIDDPNFVRASQGQTPPIPPLA